MSPTISFSSYKIMPRAEVDLHDTICMLQFFCDFFFRMPKLR